MKEDELIAELSKLIEDLDLEYAKMSLHGQATYDEICEIMAQLTSKEGTSEGHCNN